MIATSAVRAEPLAVPSPESETFSRRLRQLVDHSHRTLSAARGFRVYGIRWLRPWLTYALWPALRRILSGRIIHFGEFDARLDQCDIYTFANVFADYPVSELKRAIGEVDLVLDLGANVGGFSYLVRRLARKCGRNPHLIAVEPDPANASVLRQQPFASHLEIREEAVGPNDGNGCLITGSNSVTHRVDFDPSWRGKTIPVLSLASLCTAPALVKMDIEGGEVDILRAGLPEQVRYLVLEWHGEGAPTDFVAGNWQCLSRDIYGSSMWWLAR